jgi:hypothetical protein
LQYLPEGLARSKKGNAKENGDACQRGDDAFASARSFGYSVHYYSSLV